MNPDNRRSFMKTALASVAGLFTFAPLAKASTPIRGTVSAEEFLKITELSTQKSLLIDSIIKKNPRHVELSEQDIAQLKSEGSALLDSIFQQLINENLSQSDMADIVNHLSRPAEKKWAQFNKSAVQKARSIFIGQVDNLVAKRKA
jgi:hypothetical protein